MLISEYLHGVRDEFSNLAALADEKTAATIERIATALEPAMRQRLIEAVNALVAETNLETPSPLTVTVEGDQMHINRLATEADAPGEANPRDLTARFALRLSDDLKSSIESMAGEMGSSVNSWIVRTLERSVHQDWTNPPSTPRSSGRTLRGRGQA